MTHLRKARTSRQRRRAGTTLVLAAATGGLLAAAMAGSPTARADDPYTDILTDSQGAITLGEADYTAAGADFSTAGDTNAGLIASFIGFDNIFISPGDYTLLGLTAAGTNTNFSFYGSTFNLPLADLGGTTAAEQAANATSALAAGQADFTAATSALSGGEYFLAMDYFLVGSYDDLLASQADTLAALFSAGI